MPKGRMMTSASTPAPRRNGFTLIELMIVVAIVAILAAIAFPSYQEHMKKAHRAAAQSFLMDVAQRQQQYLMDSRSYAADLATLTMTMPTEVSTYYTVTVAAQAGPPPAFTVTATPRPGTVQASDPTLTLDNLGTKTPSTVW